MTHLHESTIRFHGLLLALSCLINNRFTPVSDFGLDFFRFADADTNYTYLLWRGQNCCDKGCRQGTLGSYLLPQRRKLVGRERNGKTNVFCLLQEAMSFLISCANMRLLTHYQLNVFGCEQFALHVCC